MNNKIKLALIIAVGIFAVILSAIFIVQNAQNSAFVLETQIDTAESDIKIQEKRRTDLIPNLVDCVKDYNDHEYQTLMDVVKSRGTDSDVDSAEIKTMINAVAEAYPELKSDTNYKNLMNELTITENLIAEYRSNYNKQVKEYNKYVRKFPTRNFLELLGYDVQEYQYLDYDAPVDAPQNLFSE